MILRCSPNTTLWGDENVMDSEEHFEDLLLVACTLSAVPTKFRAGPKLMPPPQSPSSNTIRIDS
eukprot:4132456-Amphidinium_carterae.1